MPSESEVVGIVGRNDGLRTTARLRTNEAGALSSSATSVAAITPSDSTTFTVPYRGLYVGVTGNVAIRCVDGTTATFVAVPAGAILPVECDRILSTGTTATSIVGLK